MLSPMCHSTLTISILFDVLPGATIIKLPRLEEGDVAEAIPLGPGLSV